MKTKRQIINEKRGLYTKARARRAHLRQIARRRSAPKIRELMSQLRRIEVKQPKAKPTFFGKAAGAIRKTLNGE